MADTLRQQIGDAIDTLLKTISTVNLYETNLGNNIFQWEKELPQDVLLGASWMDTIDDITQGEPSIAEEAHNLTVEIVGKANEVGRPPLIARAAMGDVVKAFGSDNTLGGLVNQMFLINQTLEKNHGEDVISSFSVVMNMMYQSNRLTPF